MKKSFRILSLIISALVITSLVVSCGKKKVTEEEAPQTTNPTTTTTSPAPAPGGNVPKSVLPAALQDTVCQFFTINAGENPPAVYGQFVSNPHNMLFTNIPDDTVLVYNDRYIGFFRDGDRVDFYGKQWNDTIPNPDGTYGAFIYETKRHLNVIGEGDGFTCYYLTEGYPNGRYAKYSTIFSGNWKEELGGLGNFQVAVIMLETSGNQHLAPKGTFHILGDGNGRADTTTWIDSKKAFIGDIKVSDEDAFRIFRVK